MPTQAKAKGGSKPEIRDSYGAASQRPLHALFFLLPLIAAYELGTTHYLSDPGQGLTETIGAHSFLLRLFGHLGEYGRYIPAALLVTVLLLLHLFRRDPLSLKFRVIVGIRFRSGFSVCLYRSIQTASARLPRRVRGRT